MIESYLRGFERIAAGGGATAPDWARSMRLSAITRFETLGFPTTKNEDWHFTSVAPIAEREFDLLAPPKHGVKAAQLAPFAFGATDWHTLVFVNGRYDAGLSSASGLPEGVTLVPLKEAYETLPLDAILGDATLYSRQDMVEASWSAVQPIMDVWHATKFDFPNYAAGTWGPKAADEMLARRGHEWRKP